MDRESIFEKYLQKVDYYGISTDIFRNWCKEVELSKQPASTKWHGAYEGGLLDHILNVTDELMSYTINMGLYWERNISPILIGLLHDICKYDAYIKTDEGYKWNEHQLLTGHGEKSVMLASQFFTLTEEEILCIRWHMGAYESKDIWSNMQDAQIKYPNVMWVHQADMVASRTEMKKEIEI